jgi:branched-subunit amino acid transport protein
MSLWLVFIAAGLLTYATRLSFFWLFERLQPPGWVQRALRFVPPAVLAAIIAPELLLRDGMITPDPLNPRLIAGLLAGLVAWRTKNVILAILVGMGMLVLLGFL